MQIKEANVSQAIAVADPQANTAILIQFAETVDHPTSLQSFDVYSVWTVTDTDDMMQLHTQ